MASGRENEGAENTAASYDSMYFWRKDQTCGRGEVKSMWQRQIHDIPFRRLFSTRAMGWGS